jgi:hypothetical protein
MIFWFWLFVIIISFFFVIAIISAVTTILYLPRHQEDAPPMVAHAMVAHAQAQEGCSKCSGGRRQ